VSGAVRATVLRFLAVIQEGDLAEKRDRVSECFAEDALYHVQVPAMEKVRGPAAIFDELIRQTGHYTALKCEILGTVTDGRSVVVERIDHLTLPGGLQVANELIAVFEGDESGRITAWREYWDSAALGQRIQAAAAAAKTDEERR
jgi:limonene-1,2-epoxide hydrolase